MSNLDENMNPLQARLVPEFKLYKSAVLLCFIFPVHRVQKGKACKMLDFSVSPEKCYL